MNLRRVPMLILVFCLAPGLVLAEEIRKEFHESFDVSPGAVLELHCGDGDVTVTPWDQQRIQVDVQYHADITKIGLGSRPSFDVDFRQSGDRVVVQEQIKGSMTIGFYSHSQITYTWEIKAPAWVGLEFHGDDGDVRITGWKADVELMLDDGDLALSDITADSVRINLDDGDVEGHEIDARLQINSDDGDVRITCLSCPEMTLANDDGDIDIEFTGPVPGQFTAATDDGDVRLRFPAQASFTYDIETDDGRVRLNLPGGDNAGREEMADGGKVSGVVGNGGGLVKIRTDDGSVELMTE